MVHAPFLLKIWTETGRGDNATYSLNVHHANMAHAPYCLKLQNDFSMFPPSLAKNFVGAFGAEPSVVFAFTNIPIVCFLPKIAFGNTETTFCPVIGSGSGYNASLHIKTVSKLKIWRCYNHYVINICTYNPPDRKTLVWLQCSKKLISENMAHYPPRPTYKRIWYNPPYSHDEKFTTLAHYSLSPAWSPRNPLGTPLGKVSRSGPGPVEWNWN